MMKLHIRRQLQSKLLIWILFFGPFLMFPLMQFFGFPEFVKYIMDVSWVLLVMTIFVGGRLKAGRTVKILAVWVIGFLLFTMLNYLVHFQSIFYYLWGFRNNFRGYVLFLGVAFYFTEDDADTAMDLLNILFYINAVLMLIQFFSLGYQQDSLGGIFGVITGCNGYTNIFFCIVLSISFVEYLENKISISILAVKAVLMLVLAAMAEIKFFYLEFVVILAAGVLFSKFSWKKFLIVAVAALAIVIGYRVFMTVFPGIDLSVTGLYETATSEEGYTGSGDLNRLAFMGRINQNFLVSTADRLFGLGLGNCDYADGKAFLTTPFYARNEALHYTWLSTAFMYLENGWLGLLFFFGFFVYTGVKSLQMSMKKGYNRMHCLIAALCCLSAVMIGFYNASLRTEAGYMLYFIIAIPWCRQLHAYERQERRLRFGEIRIKRRYVLQISSRMRR